MEWYLKAVSNETGGRIEVVRYKSLKSKRPFTTTDRNLGNNQPAPPLPVFWRHKLGTYKHNGLEISSSADYRSPATPKG